MNYIAHMIRLLLISLILILGLLPSYSAIKGGVDYKIPFDYTKLNQSELSTKADYYYNLALQTKTVDDNMISALNLYSLLTNAYPDNITYSLRLGKLYDVLGVDRYAKGNFYLAMNVDKSRPEPYFYLGDFYFTREQYRKALKFYEKAYERGYFENYTTLEKIGIIYQKFGDTEKALQYLQCASTIAPNEELDKKLDQVKNADDMNKEYYKK